MEQLLGDSTKARNVLWWKPTVGVKQLSWITVEHDLEMSQRELVLRDAGYGVGTCRDQAP